MYVEQQKIRTDATDGLSQSSMQELSATLARYGVDTQDWGKGSAKELQHLFDELKAGESRLVEEAGRLVRACTVVRVDVLHSDDSGKIFKLFEARQIFAPRPELGETEPRSRERPTDFAVWEKVHQAEHCDNAALRAVLEELPQIKGAVNVCKLGFGNELEVPIDYPGIPTRLSLADYCAWLSPAQFNRSGYREEQIDKTTIFEWNELPERANMSVGHIKARRERPEEYPMRFFVPDDKVPFTVTFNGYAPEYYVSPRTIAKSRAAEHPHGLADPEDFSLVDKSTLRSYEGPIVLDTETGLPLNPRGRTGITGRGMLWFWGPNRAADMLITRPAEMAGEYEFLAILRANGKWAMPAGMEDQGETPIQTVFREVMEETSLILTPQSAGYFKLICQCYVDDPENTDNAWKETTLYHMHFDRESALVLPIGKGDDALDIAWFPVSAQILNALHASHGELITSAMRVFKQS